MNLFFESFSNRELAILIWVGLFIIFMLFKKKLRVLILQLVKGFFEKRLFTIVSLLIIYIEIIILVLLKFHLWNLSLLKETIFWSFGVAFVLLLNNNKAKDIDYFKKIIIQSVKWTIILEFLNNFYTFGFKVELTLTPIFIFIAIIKAFAKVSSKKEKKYDQVNKFITNTLIIIGLLSIIFILYKTMNDYKNLFTLENLKELLINPIFTILFIPFLYILSVWMSYEELFKVCIDPMTSNIKLRRKLKQEIFKSAKLNLNKIVVIRKNINSYEFSQSNSLKQYLLNLLKKE